MKKLFCVLGPLLLSPVLFGQTSTTVSGSAPPSSTTTIPAASTLVVLPVSGGDNSAATGTAGQGSSMSLATGAGGNASTPLTNTSGGGGGTLTISTGSGGGSTGSGTVTNGGDIVINLGAAGTTGGTSGNGAGRAGAMFFPAGTVNSPSICGPTSTGICLYWLGANSNLLAWRDCTPFTSPTLCPQNGNQVSGALDDQGVRLANQGAIRITSGNLTSGTLDTCVDRVLPGVLGAGSGPCGNGQLDNGTFQGVGFNVKGLSSGTVTTTNNPVLTCPSNCVSLASGNSFNSGWVS